MEIKRVRITHLKEMKAAGEKIAMLTAYDATWARLLDRAGIDVLLVGDSLGMVILGYESTVPVTLEDMIHHIRAVSRGARRALVVADMPFLSYQLNQEETMRNAGRLVQEGGAAAVKIEGAGPTIRVTRELVQVGIPVMGHLGLTPQHVHQMGGMRGQARSRDEGSALVESARALEEAGAFALVLESISSEVAAEITRTVSIPTIGIGAGPCCDGQVLVNYDAFGLFDAFRPSFVKRYAELDREIVRAAKAYADDVRQGRFPDAEHTPYHLSEKLKAK